MTTRNGPPGGPVTESRPVGEDDLTAYVDGQLSAERRALVDEWLSRHPEHRARIEADIALADRLKRALDPVAEQPLPDRFRVDRLLRRRRSALSSAALRLAAVLALVAVGVAAGWFLRERLEGGAGGPLPVAQGARPELTAALVAHRVYVPERLHPVEVAAESRKHLAVWLSNRLGARVTIPDLSAQGFTLVGGRLLPADDGPAGLLMYQDDSGLRLTVYLAQGRGEESAFAFARDGQVNMLGWRSPDLAYVVSGPFDRDRLVQVAHAIEQASRQDRAG